MFASPSVMNTMTFGTFGRPSLTSSASAARSASAYDVDPKLLMPWLQLEPLLSVSGVECSTIELVSSSRRAPGLEVRCERVVEVDEVRLVVVLRRDRPCL